MMKMFILLPLVDICGCGRGKWGSCFETSRDGLHLGAKSGLLRVFVTISSAESGQVHSSGG